MKDDSYGENNEDKLFDEPDRALDDLQPYISVDARLSVRSTFDDVKTAFVAGAISFQTSVRGLLPLMGQGLQEIDDLWSSDAARVATLSEKVDTSPWVEAIGCKRDDTL